MGSCCCGDGAIFIFPCSGGSNTGELSDRIARELDRTTDGKMYCLAGIGGNVSGIVESTKSADKIVVIDGCPVDCAKKTLEQKGFISFVHARVTDLGVEKYKTTVTPELVRSLTDRVRSLAALSSSEKSKGGVCCG